MVQAQRLPQSQICQHCCCPWRQGFRAALEARPGMRHHTVRYGEAVARRVASSPVAAEVDGSPIIGTLSFQPQNCSKRKFANEKEMNRYIICMCMYMYTWEEVYYLKIANSRNKLKDHQHSGVMTPCLYIGAGFIGENMVHTVRR